jgi:hypothetical protein
VNAVEEIEDPFRRAVRNLTFLGALVGYAGLAIYVGWETWDAAAGTPPTVPGVQSAALGALAVALGAGYAMILGIPPKEVRRSCRKATEAVREAQLKPTLAVLEEMARRLLDEEGAAASGCAGVSVAFCGIVDDDRGCVLAVRSPARR